MRLLALLVAAAAVLSWPLPVSPAYRRASALQTVPGAAAAGPARSARARRWLVAAVAGTSVAVAWAGPAGLVAGAAVAVVATRVLARSESAAQRRLRLRRAEDLPGALDLICVCLRAGLPVSRALTHVAAALDGPLHDDIATICALHDLGADARAAWSELTEDPVLAPVARSMARAGASGSALATALSGVAEQCRGELQERSEVAARRVGVFVLAPLGLCFLPAFVCLGVVPTILGIADTVLG